MRDYSNSSHLLLKLPFYLVEGLTLKNGYFISALVFLERFNQSLFSSIQRKILKFSKKQTQFFIASVIEARMFLSNSPKSFAKIRPHSKYYVL